MLHARHLADPRRSQRGAALITALLLLVIMTVVAVSAVGTNVMEQRMAGNLRDSAVARNAAMSGMQAELLRLAEGACTTATGFSDELGAESPPREAVGGGYFEHVIVNNVDDPGYEEGGLGADTDGVAILQVTGRAGPAEGGQEPPARAMLEMVLQRSVDGSPYVLRSEGNLSISGPIQVTGCWANIHANGDAVIAGAGRYEGPVYAHGTIEVSDSIVDDRPGSAAVPLPSVNIAGLVSGANVDFVLHSDGTIRDPNGNPVDAGNLEGWSFAGDTWTLNGDSSSNGVYHVHGNAVIAGSPGTAGTPWNATVITDGNLRVQGQLVMASAAPGLQLSPDTGELLLVAGGELDIAPEGDSTLTGSVVAVGRLEVEGSSRVEMTGQLMTLGDAWLSGDLHLDSGKTAEPKPPKHLAWRTVLR